MKDACRSARGGKLTIFYLPCLLRHKDGRIGDGGENRRVTEIEDDAGVRCIGKVGAQALSITGAEVLVAGDETQHAPPAEQLQGPLEEINVEVRHAGERLILSLDRLLERLRLAVTARDGHVLQLFLPDIWGIADKDIKHAVVVSLRRRKAEHPAGVEERGGGVGVIGVPLRETPRIMGRAFHGCGQCLCQSRAEFTVAGAQGFLVLVPAGGEIIVPHPLQLVLQSADLIRTEQELAALKAQQGVGGHNLGLQVRQRKNAQVGFLRIYCLIHNERNEKSELGDLAGDGLNVHAVEAIFDEIEFAAVIVVVARKGAFNRLPGLFARRGTVEGIQGRFLTLPPALVIGVELLQHVDELLQQAHREGAGTARRIKGFQVIDCVNQRLGFLRGEVVAFLFPGEQPPQFLFYILCARSGQNPLKIRH